MTNSDREVAVLAILRRVTAFREGRMSLAALAEDLQTIVENSTRMKLLPTGIESEARKCWELVEEANAIEQAKMENINEVRNWLLPLLEGFESKFRKLI